MKTNMRKHYEAPRLFVDSFAPDTIISSFAAIFGAGPAAAQNAAPQSNASAGSPMNGNANSCVGTNTVIGDAQGGEVCAW